jgi:hypothetical protein
MFIPVFLTPQRRLVELRQQVRASSSAGLVPLPTRETPVKNASAEDFPELEIASVAGLC